jgi:hypothetical protein
MKTAHYSLILVGYIMQRDCMPQVPDTSKATRYENKASGAGIKETYREN